MELKVQSVSGAQYNLSQPVLLLTCLVLMTVTRANPKTKRISVSLPDGNWLVLETWRKWSENKADLRKKDRMRTLAMFGEICSGTPPRFSCLLYNFLLFPIRSLKFPHCSTSIKNGSNTKKDVQIGVSEHVQQTNHRIFGDESTHLELQQLDGSLRPEETLSELVG